MQPTDDDQTTNTSASGVSGQATIRVFKPEELLSALFSVYDIMEGSQIPFMLFKNTAYQAKHDQPLTAPLELGTPNRYFVKELVSLLETFRPNLVETDGFFTWIEPNGVPVFLRRVKRNYYFFKTPDTVFYGIEAFKIPNPFDLYWSSRHIVR